MTKYKPTVSAPTIPTRVTPKIYTAQYGQVDMPQANLLKPFYSYGVTFSDRHMAFTDHYFHWLAPDWWLVAGYKAGQGDIRYKDAYHHIKQAEFATCYFNLLNQRYSNSPQRFWDILAVDYPIVLCCFCETGHFCHRLLCAEWLISMARSQHFEIVNGGELTEAEVKP